MRARRALSLLGALCLALPLAGHALGVSSPKVDVYGDTTTFIFGLRTAPFYSPPNAPLLYDLPGPGPSATSHMTIHAGGVAYDLGQLASVVPLAAVGTGTGAYLEGVRDIPAASVRVTVHYEITDNPQDNAAYDTMKVRLTLQNYGPTPVPVGARIELDTNINFNDGANISVDNGASSVSSNSYFSLNGAGVPGNWWGYDVAPPGTPNLVGRGTLFGNPIGEAATQPDALEVAYWGDTSTLAQWSPAPVGTSISGDSSVVLWWTGTGDATGPSRSLAPGASVSFVTYYGLNTGTLLATFTPTPTFVSPTQTPTISPTRTLTPSFSASPSYSATPSVTASPSITPTFSASPSFTISPTFSLSPTFSVTPTITLTATPTPLPLLLKLLPANPDPASVEAWLPYHLSADADVDIQVWTVAGERVRRLHPGWRLTGYREDVWDLKNEAGTKVGSGIYIYRIKAVSALNETKQDFSKLAVSR